MTCRSLSGVAAHRGAGLIMPCQQRASGISISIFLGEGPSLLCVCGDVSLSNWTQTMSHRGPCAWAASNWSDCSVYALCW